jgi:hypothetical protein
MFFATNVFILFKQYIELHGKITQIYMRLLLVYFKKWDITRTKTIYFFLRLVFPISFSLSSLLRPSNLSPCFLQLPLLLSLHWQAGEKWDLERHFLSLLVFRRVLRWDLIQLYSNYTVIEKYFFLGCGMKQNLSRKDHRNDTKFCSGQKTLAVLTLFADYVIHTSLLILQLTTKQTRDFALHIIVY